MGRGHYGCLFSLDERASVDTSTCEQMLVEAQGRKLWDVMVWPLNLNKRASFGMSTWQQVLIEAEGRTSEIQDDGLLWGHAG